MRNRMLIWLLLGGGAFVLLAVLALALAACVWRRRAAASSRFGPHSGRRYRGRTGGFPPDHRAIEALRRLRSPSARSFSTSIRPAAASPCRRRSTRRSSGFARRRTRSSWRTCPRSELPAPTTSRAPADKIIANPGTIVGSIGVIAEWVNYGELLRMGEAEGRDVQDRRIQGYRFSTRDLTEREKAIFRA